MRFNLSEVEGRVLDRARSCICGGVLSRHPLSDYWQCDHGHSIYRGPEPRDQPRYELRRHNPDEIDPWFETDQPWMVWDHLNNEPVYDPSTAEEYAWGITESRARSWYARLS